LGICFPPIKQESYQCLSHQGIVPALLIVFPQVLRPRENAAENKRERYVFWWSRERGLFLCPARVLLLNNMGVEIVSVKLLCDVGFFD